MHHLLSKLTPHAEEILGVHHSGFQRNRSTFHHIFRIHQIHEKTIGMNEPQHQLLLDIKKAYDSVEREVF